MADYTKYKRGSEWRKWDLHIHTPGTKKNDHFDGTNLTEKWKKFIDTINNSKEEIAVIGITDYFCLENYFKFKEFVDSKAITKSFELVIPNVEIRVLPVTGSSTPINLHCLFNPNIDREIETRFLSKLKFDFSGSNYSAKKEELIRLGRALPGKGSLNEEEAHKAGINQYVVSMESLKSIFEKDEKLRDNAIIIVSNKSTDGVSGIRKHSDFFTDSGDSQMDATRWSIYQFADAIFSANESDVLYFIGLGSDSRVAVLEKCKTLMPCFHGCDAHSNEKVFNPDNNRFCWIKADPTFEGLKQTIFEPEDRVKIQNLRPDIKNERYIIDEIKFTNSDKLFGDKRLLLNENLNAIIGGKSSGKSLLMYTTAQSIDPEQVKRTSQRLNFDGYNFSANYDLQVIWKNGDVDTLSDLSEENKLHKITYIPQLYINHLVEKNNKEDLNALIRGILLQQSDFKQFFESSTLKIGEQTTQINKLLEEYLKIRSDGIDLRTKSKELGDSRNITKSIESIEKQISDGQKASNLNESEFEEYKALVAQKSKVDFDIAQLDLKSSVLDKILGEIHQSKVDLIGSPNLDNPFYIKGKIDRIIDGLGDLPADVGELRTKVEKYFEDFISNLKADIEKFELKSKKADLVKTQSEVVKKLEPFVKKIAGQKELEKIANILKSEQSKLQKAIGIEKQLKGLTEEYSKVRSQIAKILKSRFDTYIQIVNNVNSVHSAIGEDIKLRARLIYKAENFDLYSQVNKSALNNNHYFNSLFKDNCVVYDAIPSFYEGILRRDDDKLIIDKKESIPLRNRISLEEVLSGLIKDKFEIDYSVTYKGDELLNMSPGKKGTVLLILFLQISTAEFPIFIDQPEDNLDNRTIYDLLCKMIKQKKKERQIIIVSHNANLVVATDTENIVVANQQGQGVVLTIDKPRFEYVNGSLEHSFNKNRTEKSELLRQGIREHVCDILEGGDEAFKQRERKYSIK